MRLSFILPALAFLIGVHLPSVDAATLTGETNRPTYSVFVRGEPVRLSFSADGLGQQDRTLAVTVEDADGGVVLREDLSVQPDQKGRWNGSLTAPSSRLGFFRVTARLSTGEVLPAVGSRAAGFMTYLVVIPPSQRVQPGEDARFGMQGGFTSAFDARPYLGIHWVLGDYSWGQNEPDHPGQFAEKLRQEAAHPDLAVRAEQDVERKMGILSLPTLLNGTPKWALVDNTAVGTTGVIKNFDAWRRYCLEVGRAESKAEPDLRRHVYQITWEPVYPWGYPGTPADLVRTYRVAYPALHQADPKALVIGPTGAGISSNDLDWNESLFKQGLGHYIDGFSIHPYVGEPPETHDLIAHIRALKEMVRLYTGRDVPFFGTEQGWATGQDASKERSQAMWLTRSYLIMLGEGFRMNMAFYFADYPSEPGFGFFHNLNPKIPWGTDKVSPKPAAGAFAALTMLIEGTQTIGPIEWLGKTSLGYAFERGGKVTLALWDYGDFPHTLRIPVGAPSAEVFDWMGNERTVRTSGGSLPLTLGPTPIYIRGVSAALWGKGARRSLSIEPARAAAFPGGKLRFVVHTSAGLKPGPAVLHIEPPVELRLAAFEKAVVLRARGAGSVPVELAVPADAPYGAFPVRATLERGVSMVGVAAAMAHIEEPFLVTGVQPASDHSLAISLRSSQNTPVAGMARVRLRGVPGTRLRIPFRLAAKGAAVILAAFTESELQPQRVYHADITLVSSSGVTVPGTYRATFLSIARMTIAPRIDGSLSDWRGIPALVIRGREQLVRRPELYRGEKDLSARLRYGWDDHALYLAAEVTDDTFLQNKEGYDTWQQDCIQLAFDTAPGRAAAATGNLVAEAGERTNTEITLSLTGRGPEAYRTISPDATALPVGLIPPSAVTLSVKRDGDVTIYEAAFSWQTLGLSRPPHAGEVLGIAAAVNDVDSPQQSEPKALGLFGGITPVKEPAQFGEAVLVGPVSAASAPGLPPAATELQASGFLGQSQSPTKTPLPWTGAGGAAVDSQGRLWTVAGDRAYSFAGGVLQTTDPLPTAMRWIRGDRRRMLCLADDGRVYKWNPQTLRSTLLAKALAPDGSPPRDLALSRDGGFYTLSSKGVVNAWSQDGSAKGVVLQASQGKDWSYESIGVDPEDGDLLLGSGYPDNRIYRFTTGGKPAGSEDAPGGFASLLTDLDGKEWMFNAAGQGFPLAVAPGNPPAIAGDWAYYPTGAAAASSGLTWIACAQGLLSFDCRGRPGRRAGGLMDPGLIAARPDGTVLTLVEGNGRITRCLADDLQDDPLSSNANEPWRVGNGWTGRAGGISFDGTGFLVLDSVAKCLWQFDPNHTAWDEHPWVRLTKGDAIPDARGLAVDDVTAYVLEDNSVQAFSLSAPEAGGTAVSLPADVPISAVTAIAAAGNRLFLATADRVFARRSSGEALWQTAGPFSGITGLAAREDVLFVIDRAGKQIAALDSASGRVLSSLRAGDVPGGLEPVAAAVEGDWLFVTDASGHRVLRVRFPQRATAVK